MVVEFNPAVSSNTIAFGKSEKSAIAMHKPTLAEGSDAFIKTGKAAGDKVFGSTAKRWLKNFAGAITVGATTLFGGQALTSCDDPILPVEEPTAKIKTTTELANDFLTTSGLNSTLKSGSTTAPAGLDTAYFETNTKGGMGLKFDKMSADGKTIEWWTTEKYPDGGVKDYGKAIGHAETAADGTQSFVVDLFASQDGKYKSNNLTNYSVTYKFTKEGEVIKQSRNAESYAKIVKKSIGEALQTLDWGNVPRTIFRK